MHIADYQTLSNTQGGRETRQNKRMKKRYLTLTLSIKKPKGFFSLLSMSDWEIAIKQSVGYILHSTETEQSTIEAHMNPLSLSTHSTMKKIVER